MVERSVDVVYKEDIISNGFMPITKIRLSAKDLPLYQREAVGKILRDALDQIKEIMETPM